MGNGPSEGFRAYHLFARPLSCYWLLGPSLAPHRMGDSRARSGEGADAEGLAPLP